MNENKIEIFNNEEFGTVRTLTIDNEPYFVGKDVATILGYAKPLNAIAIHVDEDDSLKQGLTDSMGRIQETIIINESGLYSLILSSKLPTAKKFKRWVTAEVLPSIRKTGSYNAPDYSSLSPQLQYLISLEQKTKELEMAVQNTNRRLDNMCDTMQIKGVNWRKDTHSLVNRIATATETSPRDVYLDIYDEVEYRAGANLSVRLENLRNRLYDRGVSDSKINRLNYVDVIADDKKLTEIYIAIVKELAVRYIKPPKD